MTKLTTIPVSAEVKKELERIKGNRTWDELLNEFLRAHRYRKLLENREKLAELLRLDYEDIRVRKWSREY